MTWRPPKVGVAVPVRNGTRFLDLCLTTLRAQSYPTSAYVVDDASDDGSLDLLRGRPEWYTKLSHYEQRQGWPTTLNAAVALAIEDGCDAVFLMNTDDFLRVDCIEKLVGVLPGHDFAICYAQQINGEPSEYWGVRIPLKWPVVLEDFFGPHNPVGITTIGMVTAAAWQKAGGFSTDISLPGSWGFSEDWDFMIKLHENGGSGVLVPEPLSYYYAHGGQLHKEGLPRYDEARRLIMAKHGRS